MKEVISIHVGQAGIQTGNACWELCCLQHGIDPQGKLKNQDEAGYFQKFYSQTKTKLIPRAIHIDSQPTAIDQIKTGKYWDLFDANSMISGKEDASNNYARGNKNIGNVMIDLSLDCIRKEAQKCQNLQGFMIFNSIGGGTGSGFGSLLSQRLSGQYEDKLKLGFNIFPSAKLSNAFIQPYNSVLALSKLIDHQDISVVMDNQAIYDIYCCKNLDIQRPVYTNLNHVIAQAVSNTTFNMRFDDRINADLTEIKTNLLPFPRVNFLLTSYSPIINEEMSYKQSFSTAYLTNQLFLPGNAMSKCDPRVGKYLACIINYRGNFSSKDIGASICTLKTRRYIQFVDWCPTGFKCGINARPMLTTPDSKMPRLPQSCFMISNSTSISSVFDRLSIKFDVMYKRRAFVYWFASEGMEEGQVWQARQEVAALEKDYQELVLEPEYEQGEVEQG